MEIQNVLRRRDAAAYLKSRYGAGTPATLAKLATVGGGPAFSKFGRFVTYSPADLDEWALSRMSKKVASTSELAVAEAPGEAA